MPTARWEAKKHLKEAARHMEQAAYSLGSDASHGGLTSIIITNICTMILNIHSRIND